MKDANLAQAAMDFPPDARRLLKLVTERAQNAKRDAGPVPLVGIDLDGVLADDRHRQPFRPEGVDGDWGPYYEDIVADPLLMRGSALLRSFFDPWVGYATPPHAKLVVMTARQDLCRVDTIRWLRLHFPEIFGTAGPLPEHVLLVMRSNGPEGALPSPALKQQQAQAANRHFERALGRPCYWHAAFDDRKDVVEALQGVGVPAVHFLGIEEGGDPHGSFKAEHNREHERHERERLAQVRDRLEPTRADATAERIREAADTFERSNAQYGSNYKQVPGVMRALFPNGVSSDLVLDDARWHLLELVVVKLTRFANSGLTHEDSIHDLAVYAHMLDALTQEKNDAT